MRQHKLILAALLLLSLAGNSLASSRKPNILFILIDDMGYGDLRSYDADAAPTPRIDQLAEEGIRFTQFYVSSPICSPSRCSFVTGQWPQRWKITSYLFDRRLNERRGMAQWLDPVGAVPRPDPARRPATRPGTSASGTSAVGATSATRRSSPTTASTQRSPNFEGLGDRILPHGRQVRRLRTERDRLGVASEKLGRGKVTWDDRSIITTRFAERAIAFIDKAVADGKPFYVNLWPDDVHSPFFPPAATAHRRGEARPVSRGRSGDRRAARTDLRPRRRHAGARDNTIIISPATTAPSPAQGRPGRSAATKGNLYEGRHPRAAHRLGPVYSSAPIVPARRTRRRSSRGWMSFLDLPSPACPRTTATDRTPPRPGSASKPSRSVRTPFGARPPDRPGPTQGPVSQIWQSVTANLSSSAWPTAPPASSTISHPTLASPTILPRPTPTAPHTRRLGCSNGITPCPRTTPIPPTPPAPARMSKAD